MPCICAHWIKLKTAAQATGSRQAPSGAFRCMPTPAPVFASAIWRSCSAAEVEYSAVKQKAVRPSRTAFLLSHGGGDKDPQIIPVDLVKLLQRKWIDTAAHFNRITGAAEGLNEPVLIACIA